MEKRLLIPKPGRIIALALLVRLVMAIHVTNHEFLVGEGRVLADVASNLATGRGFMLSPEMLFPEREDNVRHSGMHSAAFEFYRRVDGFYGVLRPGVETTFFVPGYILFEAGIFLLAGVGNLAAVRVVQLVLLGTLSVAAGLSIARRFLKGWQLALAGLLMALDPFTIYYEAVPATQALFMVLFLLGILASLRALERPGALPAALAGAVWGMAYLVRPAAAAGAGILFVFIALARAPAGRKAMRLAASAGAFAVILLPWVMRLHDLTGQWRITPTQGGVNMWEFNGRIFSRYFTDELEGATLLYEPLRQEYLGRLASPGLAEFPAFTDEPEYVRDDILNERTAEFLRANPVLLLRLPLLRFVDFIKPFPLNPYPLVYLLAGAATFGVMLLFAGGGMALLVRTRNTGAVYLVTLVAAYMLMHIATASGTPQRVAADYPVAIFTTAALTWIAGRLRGARRRLGA